jgi:glycosyltransferase involved in cell wall biosynthesis
MLAPWALDRSRWKKVLAGWLVHPGALESAAGWHATSAQEEEDIRRAGFRQPVCVAPNGVEPPSDDPCGARVAYERLAPELAGRRVLLFYSRFHSKKRILELMADFAHLRPSHPAWHLLAVGVPEEYSLDRLRAEAQRLALSSSATILDGRDLPRPYPVAEAFVLPSHDENFGQVVGEALAHGVPVLTTTRTPWRELNALDAGRWVEVRDVRKELGKLMDRSPDDLRAAGLRGREWVLACFGWDESARKLAAFYAHLLRAGQEAS